MPTARRSAAEAIVRATLRRRRSRQCKNHGSVVADLEVEAGATTAGIDTDVRPGRQALEDKRAVGSHCGARFRAGGEDLKVTRQWAVRSQIDAASDFSCRPKSD